jgi:hypothetical protein
MLVVRMVQTTVDDVAGMVAVRNGLVAAVRPVDVAGLVAELRAVDRVVLGRVAIVHGEAMLLDGAVLLLVMEVSVVHVVDVALMADAHVAAAGSVLVGVVIMSMRHGKKGEEMMDDGTILTGRLAPSFREYGPLGHHPIPRYHVAIAK